MWQQRVRQVWAALHAVITDADRAAETVEEQVSIFKILKDRVSAVSKVGISEYCPVDSFTRIPVHARDFPAVFIGIAVDHGHFSRLAMDRDHACGRYVRPCPYG